MNRLLRTVCFCILMVFASVQLNATEARQLIRQGNKLFSDGDYTGAESRYRESLAIDDSNFKALFNLGNALYMQGRLEEAQEIFESLPHEAPSHEQEAKALHNLGNALLGAGDIPGSIDAYKRALRILPKEEDTRYNLAYAMQLLDEMPPENQDAPDNGEDDQKETEGDGAGEQEEGEEETPDHDEKDPATAGQDTSPDRIDRLSPEDAERILEALRQQEQEIQENIVRDERHTDPITTEREW